MKIKHNSGTSVTKIKVIFDVELDDSQVAAATYNDKYYIPEGNLPPAEKDVIWESQAMQDYQDFIESVEDLLTDYYGLEIYYKNSSPDQSFYFGMFAKDDQGNILLAFDFTFRVSTHKAHRTAESQKHKKDQKEARLQYTGGKHTEPLRKSIIVNREKFSSYMQAYIAVDDIIKDTVEIMKRKEK